MKHSETGSRPDRYPTPMRVLHWTRAMLMIGLIALGWIMTTVPEGSPLNSDSFYPLHKEFGIVAFIVATIAVLVRTRTPHPGPVAGLKKWERVLSDLVHHLMLALTVLVPVMGYCMSSSFRYSDGVPFFGLELPELLAKNDTAFAVFSWLHEKLAYTLLGLVVLHVAGVVKHRIDRHADVLPRML